jgi:hypothetical protein
MWVVSFVLVLAARPCQAQTMKDHGTPYDVDWDHPPAPQIALQGAAASPFRSPEVRLTSLLEAAFELKAPVDVTYEKQGQDRNLLSVTLRKDYPMHPPQLKWWVTAIHVEKTPTGVSCTVDLQDAKGQTQKARVDNAAKQSILETAIRMKMQPVEEVIIDNNGELKRVKVNH